VKALIRNKIQWGKRKPSERRITGSSGASSLSTAARLTVRQFDQMVESGIFDPADARRIELIRGELRQKSPIDGMCRIAKLTALQFHRMIEVGVFDPADDRRLELIHGELRGISPIGNLHAWLVEWLADWSLSSLPRALVWVLIQNPLDISALDSVPQPDLAWLKRKDYRHSRPTPADVLLLIEVSDFSLRYDREVKGPLYAQAGIQDYWIVNVPEETIEVYRQPLGARYGSVATLRRGEVARSLAFPDAPLALDKLFGEPA